MKKTKLMIMSVLFILIIVMAMSGVIMAKQYYSVVGSNPGGTWYAMVGGAAKLFTENIGGASFNVQSSGGSVENAKRLPSHQIDIALIYSSHMYEVLNGVGLAEGNPSDNIRVLFQVYQSPHYFVTLQGSGIKSMEDLSGKKVSLGPPGSGSSYNSQKILNSLGINVKGVELSYSDVARALGDHKIDALGMSGAPAAGIVELAATHDIHIIPFTDTEIDKLVSDNPFYTRGVMPAKTYEDQNKDLNTVFFGVYLACHKDVPDDIAYGICQNAFSEEGKRYLASVHPQWKTIKFDPVGVEQIGVSYHPGAKKYWTEQGKEF